MGCGIACVAIVAGVTYRRAKTAVQSRPNHTGNSTYYADFRWALDAFGIRYEMNGRRGFRFESWDEMPARAIVAVECDPPRPGNWHWVVYEGDRVGGHVLDPERPRVRRDLGSVEGKSYMKILSGH
jgi:hypothetical protein